MNHPDFDKACALLSSRPTEAIPLLTTLLNLETRPEYHSKLGIAYAITGQTEHAIKQFKLAITADTLYMPAYNNLAMTLIDLEHYHEAYEYAEKGLALNQDYGPLYNIMAAICQRTGRHADALRYLRRAAQLQQNNMRTLTDLVNLLIETANPEEAAQISEAGLQKDPTWLPLYNSRAMALRHLDRVDEGIACLRAGLDRQPDNIGLLLTLGSFLLMQGKTEDARATLEAVITFDPQQTRAHSMLADILPPNTPQARNHLLLLEEMANDEAGPAEDFCLLSFAIARHYEKLKQYSTSFFWYQKGNRTKRSLIEFDINKEQQELARIKSIYSHTSRAQSVIPASDFQPAPLFIISMPRSGSTLIEHTLSSHPQVYGAGEVPYIEAIHQHAVTSWGSIRRLTAEQLQELRTLYITKLQAKTGNKQYSLFTDKRPQNFKHIGFIKEVFPEARFIHVQRDPRDTCVSIFKHLFAGHYPYAYDLAEIGQYYQLYSDMMAYWHSRFPECILNVSYEEFVTDRDGWTRRIVEFAGLPWHNSLMAPHQNQRAVSTSSVLQVRKPIYRDAIGYWKNFEPYLGDLFAALSLP